LIACDWNKLAGGKLCEFVQQEMMSIPLVLDEASRDIERREKKKKRERKKESERERTMSLFFSSKSTIKVIHSLLHSPSSWLIRLTTNMIVFT
jgi:hypothetical protein